MGPGGEEGSEARGVIVGVERSSGRRCDFSIEAVNQVGRFEGESRSVVLD